jgi:GT2 family glycosyltransferase
VTDLAVVIVTHNSAADLPACLDSLLAHRGKIEMRVVVADSGSTDATAKVAAKYPVAFLPGENRGFAAANNRALEREDAAAARYVLFLNPDTAVLEGSLEQLIALCDARPEAGIFSVRQLDQNGDLIHTLFRFPNPGRAWLDTLKLAPLRAHGHGILEHQRYEREGDFEWAMGAFLLVRREVLRGVGWFDERFFLTSEEVDLCRRAHRAGWRLTYLPSLTIMHRYTTRRTDPWRAWVLSDHKVRYAKKWFSGPGLLLYRAALVARYASEALNPRETPALRRSSWLMTRAALGLAGPPGPAGASRTLPNGRPAAPYLER